MMALVYAVYALLTYWRGKVVPGWTSIVMIVLFLGAMQLLSLGIMGEYMGRIYNQTREIPSYVVAEEVTCSYIEERSELFQRRA